MKKVIVALVLTLLITGCGGNNARTAVDSYLKQYKNLSSEVLVDMEDVIEKENLTNEQEDKYRAVLKKQYKDLTYEIIEEEYDNDVSYVTAKITVYDLYSAQSDASIYLEENTDKFTKEDGEYDDSLFIDEKLSNMNHSTDRIEYKITFTVTKENDKYVVEQPSENDLMKIHGIYNNEIN